MTLCELCIKIILKSNNEVLPSKSSGRNAKVLHDARYRKNSNSTTITSVNYPKYFGYAGLLIDTSMKVFPGAFTGATLAYYDSVIIAISVEWNSPASKAGMRNKDSIVKINSQAATLKVLHEAMKKADKGKKVTFHIKKRVSILNVKIKFRKKARKKFCYYTH